MGFDLGDGRCRVVLMDNGSLRPEAVFALRKLAVGVGERLGVEVHPVSLLHSSKIDAGELGGCRAEVMVPFLRRMKAEGVERVFVIPLFFGPSAALVEYLPGRLEELGRVLPDVVVGDVMVVGDDLDKVLAGMMALGVRRVVELNGLHAPMVAMVDHGTPRVEVNAVRERMAALLSAELADEVAEVEACSMERRDGCEYDFNEPLLDGVLDRGDGDVVVSLMFAGPGRHAGEGGDIAEICDAAVDANGGLRVFRTRVLAEMGEDLVDFLVRRSGLEKYDGTSV